MTDFVASDLHLSFSWTDLEKARVKAFQDMLGLDDRAIYTGDVYELVWYTRKQVEACPEYQEFKSRLRPWDVVLYGNHDVVCKKCKPETCVVGDMILMHGHQFDKYAGGCAQRTYYRWAPWFRNIWFSTPWEQQMAGDQSWEEHNGQVWGTAIHWLEASKYRILVMGHTHQTVRIARPYTKKKLISVGSLPGDGSYLNLSTLRIDWIK